MVGNALSNALGGLMALAIAGIHNGNGYKSWRWIFIVEGCFTAGVTLLAYPFLPDWPTTAKWLSKEEKEILADRSKSHAFYRDSLLTASSPRRWYRW